MGGNSHPPFLFVSLNYWNGLVEAVADDDDAAWKVKDVCGLFRWLLLEMVVRWKVVSCSLELNEGTVMVGLFVGSEMRSLMTAWWWRRWWNSQGRAAFVESVVVAGWRKKAAEFGGCLLMLVKQAVVFSWGVLVFWCWDAMVVFA